MPTDSFVVLTFNVHHGEGLDGLVDIARCAEVVASTGAQLVALQELDRGLPRTGRADQPALLAEALGMRVRFFPTVERSDGGTYGIAVASGSDLEASFVELPRVADNEPRGAIVGTVEGLAFVATHLSRDRVERRAQTAALGDLAARIDGPGVVLGDLNQARRSLGTLRAAGFRSAGPVGPTLGRGHLPRQIDHIFISPEVEVLRRWRVRTQASDHHAVAAELRVRR